MKILQFLTMIVLFLLFDFLSIILKKEVKCPLGQPC